MRAGGGDAGNISIRNVDFVGDGSFASVTTSVRSTRPEAREPNLMPQYLLTLRTTADSPDHQWTQDQMRRSMADIHALNAEIKGAGAWVYGGQLDAPAAAKVVRPRNSKMRVTDGPFLEAKEQVAGFYIIEAADLNRALAWASKTSDAVGMPIEVRIFVQGET
jgi:hypothetical protein